MNKTWSRGKKKLTPSEKLISDNKQRDRVRIANLVARKPEIDKSCCICGKTGTIVHNSENPYVISFLCENCRKDSNNIDIAKLKQVDIRSQLNKSRLKSSSFSDEDIESMLTNYLSVTELLSIGDYCNQIRNN